MIAPYASSSESGDVAGLHASVSRFHTSITWNDAGVFVKDIHSANGVFVNGERLQGLTKLSPGDVLTVGDADLEFAVS